MSRIGKRPVPVPANVEAAVVGQTIKVKGPKGELSVTLPEEIKVEKTATGVTWRRARIPSAPAACGACRAR